MPTRSQIIATFCGLAAIAPTRDQASRPPTAFDAKAVPDGAFEGAWREAQVRLTRRDGTAILVHPVASLYVATRTHYSRAATLAQSDTEKVPACGRFWGNSGRYRLTHDTLTLNPIVGQEARLTAGDSIRFHVRASRDTLWLNARFSEHYLPIDGVFVPDTAGPFVAQEILLVRVAPSAAPSRSPGSRSPAPSGVGAIPKGTYEGVWREAEVRVTFQDSSVHVFHQDPSLFLATSTHYSKLAMLGYKDPATTQPCNMFWGNSGRYELSHDTLTYYPVVAKDPNLPEDEKDGERYLVKAKGDTLWMKWVNSGFLAHETLLVRLAR